MSDLLSKWEEYQKNWGQRLAIVSKNGGQLKIWIFLEKNKINQQQFYWLWLEFARTSRFVESYWIERKIKLKILVVIIRKRWLVKVSSIKLAKQREGISKSIRFVLLSIDIGEIKEASEFTKSRQKTSEHNQKWGSLYSWTKESKHKNFMLIVFLVMLLNFECLNNNQRLRIVTFLPRLV